jgi:hypothetical protein
MKNTDSSNGHLLPYKVYVQLNVLCPAMLNRVGGKIYCADIVAINNSSSVHWTTKLLEKMAQPTGFSNDRGDAMVFCLSTRA